MVQKFRLKDLFRKKELLDRELINLWGTSRFIAKQRPINCFIEILNVPF